MCGFKPVRPFAKIVAHPDVATFCLTTTIALAVYLATIGPNLTLETAGIFSTGAMYGGVPHPPGFPVWTISGWMFIKLLPVSNIAFRLGVASAFTASCACGLIAATVSGTGKLLLLKTASLRDDHGIGLVRLFAGTVVGTLMAFESSVWARALIADPWPLTLLLFAFVIFFLQKWCIAPERKRWLYAAAFLYGLAVTNSYSLLAAAVGLQLLIAFINPKIGRDLFFVNVIALPIIWYADRSGRLDWSSSHHHGVNRIGYWIWCASVTVCIVLTIRQRGILTEWKAASAISFLLALGLAVFLYGPVVSMANPPMNWAYSRTTPGFFHLITRGQFEEIHPPSGLIAFAKALWIYFRITGSQLGYLPLIVAACPALFWKQIPIKGRSWLLSCLAAQACFVLLLTAVLAPQSDQESIRLVEAFYTAPHQLLAIWVGTGIILCCQVNLRKKNTGAAGE